jgi:transposase
MTRFEKATDCGIKMFIAFAKTLAWYQSGILAYYDCRISSGPLERTSNKIKPMKRMAYGFRDMDIFKVKIMGHHAVKKAFI